MPNQKAKVEYGDFQTPGLLCDQICKLIKDKNFSPNSVLEPTCGVGSFLEASSMAFPNCKSIIGYDVNPSYVSVANKINRVSAHCEDFFRKDWPQTFSNLKDPILVIGNPPWVTNSIIGSVSGKNLPTKSNFKNLEGFDALTGKSNFDISEWMLIKLLECLSGRKAMLAMLCKTMVARKVLQYSWSKMCQIDNSSIYTINAAENFGVAVDACLLLCMLKPGGNSQECNSYPNLESSNADTVFGMRGGRLLKDVRKSKEFENLHGSPFAKWRSGVKHDCSKVMELVLEKGNSYRNGFGELVNLENDYLFPMLKSSDLANGISEPTRFMLVTQKRVGEDTSAIEYQAPNTWNYLCSHADKLQNRSSIIYRNRPKFSVFGVGSYTFQPWKIAISGFYKHLQFRCIGPHNKKPIVLDDTCYFLAFDAEEDARLIFDLLNSDIAREFYTSLIFWDSKRPITVSILNQLSLHAVSVKMGVSLPSYLDCDSSSGLHLRVGEPQKG